MPDPFRPPNYQAACCAACGKEDLKRNMMTIHISDRTGVKQVFCHLCDECFRKWTDGLKINQTTKRRKRR